MFSTATAAYTPSDPEALASVGKLMRSLQALQVSNGVGFGHHYDNFVGQGEDMGEWEQYQ